MPSHSTEHFGEMYFGRVGRFMDETNLTFMLVAPVDGVTRPGLAEKYPTWDVVIVSGEIDFMGKMYRSGDVGPVFVLDRKIEWLD